jgi:hypothetical protein
MSKDKITFNDGSVYEGETVNGKPHGKGNALALVLRGHDGYHGHIFHVKELTMVFCAKRNKNTNFSSFCHL